MKRFIKLIALILTLTVSSALVACSSDASKAKDTVEKVLTVSNATDLILTAVIMAPTEEAINTDEAIYLVGGNTTMNAKSGCDITVNFPADDYKGTWFVRVVGVDINEQMSYRTIIELGDIFNDDPALFLDDVYGFEIAFDTEDENFVVTTLDGSHI